MGTFTTPTAIMTDLSPGPIMATSPIAKSSPGIASMMSMQRMMSESIFPPA
jgi:hypothetical protein